MKVVATIGSNYLMVEISRDELANLIGFYYPSAAPKPSFEVGGQIKVSDMYRQLYKLRDAQRELKAASQTLHSIANLMLVADPLLQAVVDPEKAKAEATE
jgi:hypothetical protein